LDLASVCDRTAPQAYIAARRELNENPVATIGPVERPTGP